MLTKSELANFLTEVPPHANTDKARATMLFELLRTEPRTVSFLAEKLDWLAPNVHRFLNSKAYINYIGQDSNQNYFLVVENIRHAIMRYDVEVNKAEHGQNKIDLSAGHSMTMPGNYFTTKGGYYPHVPIYYNEETTNLSSVMWDIEDSKGTMQEYREDWLRSHAWGKRSAVAFKSNRYPMLNGLRYYDPFFTICYMFTYLPKKNRGKLIEHIEGWLDSGGKQRASEYLMITPESPILPVDVVHWYITARNLISKNYGFFIRDFSYLPDLWTKNAIDDYSMHYIRTYPIFWLKEGPIQHHEIGECPFTDKPIEDQHFPSE